MEETVGTHEEYIAAVRKTLDRALCLYDVPGIQPEHPEVEFPCAQELRLPPTTISRGATECCHVERTINSARVSLRVKQVDEMEKWLSKTWLAFLMQATYAEAFGILRRVPVAGYDLSFVITAQHCVEYPKESLVDFVCHFIRGAAAAADMKLLVSSRARAVAALYLGSLESGEATALY